MTVVEYLDIINLRVTYKNAPIHLLEKFTFKDISTVHESLLGLDLRECLVLQTCNRVEIFVITDNPSNVQKIVNYWAYSSNLSIEKFSKILVIDRGENAIRHLLKLASGLDSLVIGEDQILGQIKRSYEFSRSNNYIGSILSTLFDKSIKVGSKVRFLTSINKGKVSIGSVSVNLAEESLGHLSDKKILLIGSGEGASLVAKALKQRNLSFVITSRTFERAKSFANAMSGNPVLFDKALELLKDMDLVFVSTNAPYYLLTFDRIKKAMEERNKLLVIVDLSNPRTVDENSSNLANVMLYNMDQIGKIIQRNIQFRTEGLSSAQAIIEDEMMNVDFLLKRKKADPVVISVFRSADRIRERELNKAISILGPNLGEQDIKILEQFSHALLEGIISTPMNNLRRQIQNDKGDEQEVMRIAAKLFNYENETNT